MHGLPGEYFNRLFRRVVIIFCLVVEEGPTDEPSGKRRAKASQEATNIQTSSQATGDKGTFNIKKDK